MTYNIGIAPVQKMVGRGFITSYRQHQLIIVVGYLQQCPHFEKHRIIERWLPDLQYSIQCG